MKRRTQVILLCVGILVLVWGVVMLLVGGESTTSRVIAVLIIVSGLCSAVTAGMQLRQESS